MPLFNWSTTAATNASADATINWAEGQAPSSVNDSARAMMAAIAKYRDDIAGSITTGGTSTAYTVTTNSVFDSLAHMGGQMIAFIPHVANGATVTLAVDGLTAKPLRQFPSIELAAGQLVLGTVYVATYNASDAVFYLQGVSRTKAPTYQIFTSGSAATYTTPAGCSWLKVRMVGGGGGGGGCAPGSNTGTAGNTSTFNSVNANGGGAGGGAGAAGTAGTLGTGTATLRLTGVPGGLGGLAAGTGFGAASRFGGGAAGPVLGLVGDDAAANSGGGGAGGGGNGTTNVNGGGGGSGEYVELVIGNPAATYTYTVAGTAAGGAGNKAGGTGAAGRVVVEENYN